MADTLLEEWNRLNGRGSQVKADKSYFEQLVHGLNKPVAHVMSIGGSLMGDESAPSPSEIYSGDKDYTPRDLYNAIEDKTGMDLYFGDKDPNYNPYLYESVGNFAAEMLPYVALDPLAHGLGGVKALGRAAAGYEGVGKATALQAAAGRAGVGAVIGGLTADEASDIPLRALGGAAITAGAAPALVAGASKLGKVGDKLVDWSQRALHPEAFEGTKLEFSEGVEILRKNDLKRQQIARAIRERDDVLGLSKLEGAEAEKLSDFMDSKYAMSSDYRNKLESEIIRSRVGAKATKLPKSPEGVELYQARRTGNKLGDRFIVDGRSGKTFVMQNGDDVVKEYKGTFSDKGKLLVDDFNSMEAMQHGARDAKGVMLGGEIDNATLGKLTGKANTYVGKIVNEHLAKIGDPLLSKNVRTFVDRNRSIMDDYNKAMRTRYEKAGKEWVDTVPFDFHTQEVIGDQLKNLPPSYENIRTGLVRRQSSAPIRSGGLTLKERLAQESETFTRNYMSKAEKEASKLVSSIAHNVPKSKTSEGILKFFKGYDTFTNFLKQQHLTMSHSWVVNNFTDNLMKAYLEGGAGNAWQTAINSGKSMLRTSSDDLVKDLLKISDPKGSFKTAINFSDDIMGPALEHGAIGEGFFAESFGKGQISAPALAAKVGAERAAQIIEEAANVGGFKKAYEMYQDFLGETVGRTGQLVEGAARATLFKNTVKAISKNDDLLRDLGTKLTAKEVSSLVGKYGYTGLGKVAPEANAIFKEAARVVNSTFFDYGNISAFEQKVMKRIFPYWTFFSRNVPYWANAIGEQGGRLSRALSVYKSMGRAPTEEERLLMPDYMLATGTRIDSRGNPISIPNMSLLDALSVPEWRESSLNKLHPALKTAKQLLESKDDFGGELLPSDTKSGRKRVFGAGVKFAPIDSGTYRDESSGKLYTDSDLTAYLTMAQKNLAPMPIIDTIAKAIEDKKSKGLSTGQVLSNLGPMKQYKLDDTQKQSAAKHRVHKFKNAARGKALRKVSTGR